MVVVLPAGHPPIHSATGGCPVASGSSNPEAQHLVDLARLKANALNAAAGLDSSSATSTAAASLPKRTFTLGTRMSKLALVQAHFVKDLIEKQLPGVECKIFGMTTTGDNNTSQPLYLLGGKALWTKELEVALMDGRVDAVVHCLKDMPTELPPGLSLGAILEREDPSDALVMKAGLSYTKLEELPEGSVIGTSSVRRVAQLRRSFPKLRFADVRGTVQTRLNKLDDPEQPYSALILASAGLLRLGLGARITAAVTSPTLYHAVGQGALGMEIREGDAFATELVGMLECWKTGWTTRAERSMLRVLEGGCSVPVGAETLLVEKVTSTPAPPFAAVNDPHEATLTLTGTITSLAGTSHVEVSLTRQVHSIAEVEQLGADIAQQLIAGGGQAILTELGRHVKEVTGPEGQEMPFVSNNLSNTDAHGRAAFNVAPKSAKAMTASFGVEEGAVCLRPAGW